MSGTRPRIVGLLFRRIGDSFMAQPALRALRATYPECEIAVVCEPQCTRVFEHLTWMNEIIPVSKSPSIVELSRAVRRSGTPEVTVDFLANPRSAIASVFSGAKRRAGIAYRGRRWAYTHIVPLQDTRHPEYSAIHKLRLAQALGADTTDWRTEFALTEADSLEARAIWRAAGVADEERPVAFFVHSRRKHKRWPAERYAKVIAELSQRAAQRMVILSTPGDEVAVEEVRKHLRDSGPIILRIDNLGTLGAVLSHCAVLIGNDGGPKHVAAAVDTPTVTLFGSEPPEYWTPPISDRHSAITSAQLHGTAVLDGIQPETVIETAIRMLTRSGA